MATDFAITAWVCSDHPVIKSEVAARMDGHHCSKIEKCIRKLLSPDIDRDEDGVIDRKIVTFGDEVEQFQKR